VQCLNIDTQTVYKQAFERQAVLNSAVHSDQGTGVLEVHRQYRLSCSQSSQVAEKDQS